MDRAAPLTSGSAQTESESPSPLRGGVGGGGNPAAGRVQILGCIFAAERDDHFYVGKLAVASGMQGAGMLPVLAGLPFGHVQTKVLLPVGAKVSMAAEGRDIFLVWGHRHAHVHDDHHGHDHDHAH